MALHMRRLERWLLRKGFCETNSSSGHRHFKHPETGHKIMIKWSVFPIEKK